MLARMNEPGVTLRPLRADDVTEAYVGWLNSPDVHRYLQTRATDHTIAGVRGWVESTRKHPGVHLFGIFERSDGRHIGNVKLAKLGPHRLADVGILIGERSCWGKGYATSAIRQAADFAFNGAEFDKLSAEAYAENLGSIRAFEKAGFRVEGVRKKHFLLDGQLHDRIELGLCREDYSPG